MLKKQELTTGAWLVEWTESERGWGQRPDGAYYYPTETIAKKETKKSLTVMRKREAAIYNGATPDEYSFPETPRFVAVSKKLAKEIQEKGYAYRDRAE